MTGSFKYFWYRYSTQIHSNNWLSYLSHFSSHIIFWKSWNKIWSTPTLFISNVSSETQLSFFGRLSGTVIFLNQKWCQFNSWKATEYSIFGFGDIARYMVILNKWESEKFNLNHILFNIIKLLSSVLNIWLRYLIYTVHSTYGTIQRICRQSHTISELFKNFAHMSYMTA